MEPSRPGSAGGCQGKCLRKSLILAWVAALPHLVSPAGHRAQRGGPPSLTHLTPPLADDVRAAGERALAQPLSPLRGGKRDRGPFSVLARPRELSAARQIRELHLKHSQAHREEARELAREKAREALHLARQVGACVQMGADGPGGPVRAQAPPEGSNGQDEQRSGSRIQERHDVSSAIIPKHDHAAICGRPEEGQHVRVYLPDETSIRALLDCAPLARKAGHEAFSPPTVDLELLGALRPERQLVIYRPVSSKLTPPLATHNLEERVAVVSCHGDERIQEIADDEWQPCGAMDTD
jgi:hypothetical protein